METILKKANIEHVKPMHLNGPLCYFVPEGTTEIADCAFMLYDGDPLLYQVIAIQLPPTLKRIGENAFNDVLTNLKSVFIHPDIEEIGGWAFACLDDLQSAFVPDSVVTIKRDAFVNCPNLTIHVYGKKNEIPATWDKEWFGNCKYKIVEILDPECKVLNLEDIKNKGTGFIELATGKFKKQHWSSDSIYFTEEAFAPIAPIFVKYVPDYAYFGNSGVFNVGKKTGSKIIVDLQKLSVSDDLVACYDSLNLDLSHFNISEYKKNEIQTAIKQTVSWLEKNFEKNKHFCFLGV